MPPGVFNLVNGTGRDVGDALSRHPDVDMISFTGSTGAGIRSAVAAADTVKRVCLELGGKSANIVLPDADLEKAARWNIQRGFFNAGQSCHAPSRMLVHESQLEQVVPFLVDEVSRFRLGDPLDSATTMGPVVSAAQFKSITNLHPERSRRGRPPGHRRAGAAPRVSNEATSAAHGVHRRHTRDDDCPGGDLRARPGRHALPRPRTMPCGSPTTRPTGSAVTSSAVTETNARRVVERLARRAGSATTAPPPTRTHPWADTSSPASAGRWADSGSRSTWR